MMNALESTSTRPYLIRALYEWCTDNGLTPYIAVLADDTVRVPREYVQNGEIVLNISVDATSALKLGNDFVEFRARFAGVAREIVVPIDRVLAIYARESGQGMAFPVAVPATAAPPDDTDAAAPGPGDEQPADGPRSPIQLVPQGGSGGGNGSDGDGDPPPDPPPPPPGRKRPTLKVVK